MLNYVLIFVTNGLKSTEMDFWRRSARISRKDKIRNAIIKSVGFGGLGVACWPLVPKFAGFANF